jgi:hypothetical protein
VARAVYSQGFIYYTDATGLGEFAIPDDFTAVVRDFTVFSSLGAVDAYLIIQNSSIAPQVGIASISSVGVLKSDQWTGRVVVPGGGFISVSLSGVSSGTSVYVGGYLLRN